MLVSKRRNDFTAALPTDISQDVEKALTVNLKNICAYVQLKSLLSDIDDWKRLEHDLDVLIDEDTRIARLSHSRATNDTPADQN